MRHRRRSRRLGRSASHRRAMLRNLACSLILTERDAEFDPNPPKVKGRVVTTLQKAKEVRPLVEKCVTLARKSLQHERNAEQYASSADRGSDKWKQWRHGPQWQEWCAARAPVVAALRRALQLLGDKQAVRVLFDDIAPRFEDRDGGYTRVLRLPTPRLGDAGTQAILEFVGKHDRVTETSQRPAFDEPEQDVEDDVAAEEETVEHDAAADDEAADEEGATDEVSAQAESQDDDAAERGDADDADKQKEEG